MTCVTTDVHASNQVVGAHERRQRSRSPSPRSCKTDRTEISPRFFCERREKSQVSLEGLARCTQRRTALRRGGDRPVLRSCHRRTRLPHRAPRLRARETATSSAVAARQLRKDFFRRNRTRRSALQLLVSARGFSDPKTFVFLRRNIFQTVEKPFSQCSTSFTVQLHGLGRDFFEFARHDAIVLRSAI